MSHYKFKSLKTYISTEWLADSTKKYRQVFDRSEIKYVYVELSFYNKQFDEKDWTAQVELKAFKEGSSPKLICSMSQQTKVSHEFPHIAVREGWGNSEPSSFWGEGTYYWEAYINGEKVGRHTFYVYNIGRLSIDYNPYFELNSLGLYEGADKDGRKRKRMYYTTFAQHKTRFVWVELNATSKIKQDWVCEVTFNFYNQAHQLKGRTVELHSVKRNQKTFTITSGWGSDHLGTWFQDNYTVEVVFMDHLIGIFPFSIKEYFVEGKSPYYPPSSLGHYWNHNSPKTVQAYHDRTEIIPNYELHQVQLENIRLRSENACLRHALTNLGEKGNVD